MSDLNYKSDLHPMLFTTETALEVWAPSTEDNSSKNVEGLAQASFVGGYTAFHAFDLFCGEELILSRKESDFAKGGLGEPCLSLNHDGDLLVRLIHRSGIWVSDTQWELNSKLKVDSRFVSINGLKLPAWVLVHGPDGLFRFKHPDWNEANDLERTQEYWRIDRNGRRSQMSEWPVRAAQA